MDFGVVGLDNLVGSQTTTSSTQSGVACSDPETKQRLYGSGFLKQDRSGGLEDDWRSSKLSKNESMMFQHKTTSFPSSNTLSFFNGNDNGQKESQMLSFSCPKSESFSVAKSSQNSSSFPYLHLTSPAYNNIKNTGYGSGSLNGGGGGGGGGSMQIGVFTQTQWMELEHQALIFKYIAANVPIPSNLLFPIKKAVESAHLSYFPGSLLRPNSYGWGAFHLGFSGNTDPEPGRCRRTDGKKWRCSRDAVADQKYCERHMNRGRHRSRKPVEGQTGHSAAPASATTTNTAKTTPNAAASVVVGTQGGSLSNSLPISQQQQQQQQPELKNFQFAGSTNPSAAASLSRTYVDKEGLVSAESFLNPSHKSSSLASSANFSSAQDPTARGGVMQHSLRQFMDVWPDKHQSDCSAVVSWPQLGLQSQTPDLSISIPIATADYMSSTSSPNNDRATFSPLRLSHGSDPIQMGLGVGSGMNEPNQRQTSWIPISWGASMGGPLGEVLNNTNNNNSGECKNLSVLNLMSESWEGSPQMGSSPTGVLQRTTFGSVSNSSTGSSPRADNKISESGSLCNDLGSTLPSSMTAL